MGKNRILQHAVHAALAAAAASVVVPAAYAQTAPAAAAPSGGSELQEVVVTGTRIQSANLISASPVTTVTNVDIQASGLTRVEDLLNNLPQVFAGQGANMSNGSTGTSTGTVTFVPVTSDLVQYHWVNKTGKNAGNKGGGEWYYDSKKGEYVSLGAGTGFWGVSRGMGSADAATITLTDTYPADPANGTTTFHFAQSTISFTSDWKKGGKPMHDAQTCTRA